MRAIRSIPLLATALVACAVLLPETATAATTSCGPTEIKKASGGNWVCTFGDDFNGTALNRDNWNAMNTARTGFSHAGECYVDHPSTVGVANGVLTLTAIKLASPIRCGWFQNGWFETEYLSGMVFTGDKFAQTYGRFEARMKFPKGTGFISSFWMWPRDMDYGKQSGEIDIAEHFGAYPQIVSPYVHIKHPEGGDRGRGAYCNVANPSGGFHTYTLEWLPLGGLKFSFDGVPCMIFSNWDPGAPLSYPQPFDKPFFLLLTLAFGWNENSVTESTPFPANFVVDYVRAWR